MGIPSLNDGSVERADIDGKNRKVNLALTASRHHQGDLLVVTSAIESRHRAQPRWRLLFCY
jgi:hypothetical protein